MGTTTIPTAPPAIAVGRFSGANVKARVAAGWVPIRTTRGAPRYPLPYDVVPYKTLAPSPREFRIADRDEFAAAYRARLDEVGVDRIVADLAAIIGPAPGGIVLCFENMTRDPWKWCHRTVFAGWWLDRVGVPAPELDDVHEPATPLFD